MPDEGRVLSDGDPCLICQPGRVWLMPDGYLACSNCLWNSEEDEPKSRITEAEGLHLNPSLDMP